MGLARGALLALLLGLACGRAEEEPPGRAALPRPEPAPAIVPGAAPALPARGEFEVRFGASGIEARANQAPRQALLEAIARETGLVAVAFVEGGDPNGRVTMQSEGESIEVVLARALAGVPFSIEPLDAEGRVRLALVVGKRSPAPAAAREARRATPRQVLDPRERARNMREQEDEALAKLDSNDARERVEGVEWADLTSVLGYEAVLDRLANDADPAVRAAAAESLSGADVGAVRPLLTALDDPDPRVVISALDSLEMLGDESIVPEVSRLLRHPEPSVRARAEEAMQFLE
jgi:HEAT repeats